MVALRRFLAALPLLWLSCGDKEPPKVARPGEQAMQAERTVQFEAEPERTGLRIELSDARPPADTVERPPLAATTPLSDAETHALLGRLPPLPDEAEAASPFARRAESLPAPRPGIEVDVPFPPPGDDTTPEAMAGPVTVLRAAPEGDVPLAPHLSVTFDQPMIAVTTQDQAAAVQPVTLVPQPPGQWRWLGTRTVIFEPSVRFPMATEYTATVAAGTASAAGTALARTWTQTFRTPPPRLVGQHPVGGPWGRQPVVFLGFDQQVDPDAILDHLELRAGGARVKARRATSEEIAEDTAVARLVEASDKRGPSRWLAARPSAELPYDTSVEVALPPGTPSAEGPRTTTSEQRFSFTTYGRFELTGSQCGYQERCRPGDDIVLVFSNPIDVEAFEVDQVEVEPAIPDASIYAAGQRLVVGGAKRPETTTTITVAAGLRDVFGQVLTRPVAISKTTSKSEPMSPWLGGSGPDFRVLDPGAPPSWRVYTINHERLRLRVFRVTPEDWVPYGTWRSSRGWWDRQVELGDPPGTPLADEKQKVAAAQDEMVETTIDLSPWLAEGRGQLLLWAEAIDGVEKDRRQQAVGWVQATGIGLSAFSDRDGLSAWATSLSDGAPLSDVAIEVQPQGWTARTAADGLAAIPFPSSDGRGPQLLVARRGDDLAMLPDSTNPRYRSASWTKRSSTDTLAWFVFDDRNLYKPRETVKVKGWVRRLEQKPGGDVTAPPDGYPRAIGWRLVDSRGNELSKGTTPLVGLGGFDLTLDLPDAMNLGTARLLLEAEGSGLEGASHALAFEVQEFRRPEFEVNASAEPGPHLLGETAVATVNARYFAGGGLPGAPVRWRASQQWATFRPPNQEGWQFGQSVPRWWWGGPVWGADGPSTADPDPLDSTTDALGDSRIALHFAALDPPRPVDVTAEAVVTDVNRQAWAAKTTLLVHPSAVYVGVRTPSVFTRAGERFAPELAVVDIDGHPVAGRPIEATFKTTRWTRQKDGSWEEEDDDVQTCSEVSQGAAGADPFKPAPVTCALNPARGGRYELVARTTDSLGRPNETRLTVWVAGPRGVGPQDRSLQEEQVVLVPDKDQYAPGDVAEILVQSPFGPAHGVLTLRRIGLVETRAFEVQGDSAIVTVPITEAHLPKLQIGVDLAGSAVRTDDEGAERSDLPPRPAYGSGELSLDVSTATRTLGVSVEPRDAALESGGSTTLDIVVRDPSGKPLPGAEVAIVVVDEAILALTGYRIADPIASFYVDRGSWVNERHLRSLLQLAAPPPQAGAAGGKSYDTESSDFAMPPPAPRSAPGGSRTGAVPEPAAAFAMAEADQPPPPSGPAIEVRSDFRALALFLPAERTGDDGKLAVPVTLPDSLTRYRVTVIAAHGASQFGSAESDITARKPLMLRPSPPRFLHFGDRFELPLVVQNQTDDVYTVALAAGVANVRFGESRAAGVRFSVPPNDRVEVRLPTTTRSAGTARFAVALSGRPEGRRRAEATDAASFDLPVWTPATSEAFATYGEIGDGPDAVAQPIGDPGDVWPQFGGLEVTTSSTALSALTDAVLYLVEYPFECAEQRASRVLAVAALRDVLAAFEVEGMPSPEALEAAMRRDLDELARLQNSDGGWGFWRRGDESWPFVSLHVAHALARAKAKGYEPDGQTWALARRYLRDIDRRIPHDYPPSVRHALQAHAIYVLRAMGEPDPKRAERVLAESGGIEGDLGLDGLAWLLPTLHGGGRKAEVEQILRFLSNRADETASTATFTSSYGEGDYLLLHSSRRTDAAVLEALLEVRPEHDLITKVAKGLLAHRTRGRWGSTQENAWVLLALDRYFAVREAVTPDFVARAWLGDRYAGDHRFNGRTTDHATISVPMSEVVSSTAEGGGSAPLVLQRDGKGRMYYRIGLRYAPRSLELEPADRGFTVLRTYEAVDDPADVRRDDDGTWHIAAGARARVRITMVAPSRRYHVALVDPLPAGLEVINPELAVSEDVPGDPEATKTYWWWWRPWYQHENLRDERVEAFTTLLWPGVHTYTYVARATTPGTYVVPPTKAEEMYMPETFGRSGTERVVVGD